MAKVFFTDRYGNKVKKGSRVELMKWGKTGKFGTVIDDPRPSLFTPWYILLTVLFDESIYPDTPELKDKREFCLEISEVIVVGEGE